MSTQVETSVRASVVVEAPVERAFAVFIEDFDRIQPREHNILEVEIAGRTGETLYLRVGDWLVVVASIVLLAAAIFAGRRTKPAQSR